MNQLIKSFSADIVNIWSHFEHAQIHHIQRDPHGAFCSQIGIFKIEHSVNLNQEQCQVLKETLLNEELWLFDSKARHYPLPSHLLTMSTTDKEQLFFITSGQQFGLFDDDGLVYVDVKDSFVHPLKESKIL